jgi:hypothetical protein
MQGINLFDVAAGISLALLLIGGALYWGRQKDQGSRVVGFGLFLVIGCLILWRASCWTGHMVCT